MTMMKLAEISSRTYATSVPEDLTHQLTFRQEPVPSANAMTVASSLTLYTTAAEAEEYDLGGDYDVIAKPRIE